MDVNEELKLVFFRGWGSRGGGRLGGSGWM